MQRRAIGGRDVLEGERERVLRRERLVVGAHDAAAQRQLAGAAGHGEAQASTLPAGALFLALSSMPFSERSTDVPM